MDPSDSILGMSVRCSQATLAADKNPLIIFYTPGSSSSGSAVSVAAGMAPLALGTETDGSTIAPSDRASLYWLKLTVEKASTHGTLPFTRSTDGLGPMAKSTEDVASVLDIHTSINNGTHREALGKTFQSGSRPLSWLLGTRHIPTSSLCSSFCGLP